MSNETTPLTGVITITLDGVQRDLLPTANAALRLSRLYGGLGAILPRIGSIDIDVFANIIRFGLNLSDKEALKLPEKLFTSNISDLALPLSKYISALANGGKIPNESGEIESDETEGNA